MARLVVEERKAYSGTSTGEQKEYTPEERKAYEEAGNRLAFELRELVEGDTFEWPCAVKVGDSEMHAKTFQGVTTEKKCRRIVATLLDDLYPLQYDVWSADNIQNDKTQLNSLYRAVKREVPPPQGVPFQWDADDLEVDNILVVLQKGGKRNDGKRGGHFLNVRGFKARRASRPSAPAATTVVDEDSPF